MQTGKDNRNIFHWVFKTTEFTGKKATYIYIYICSLAQYASSMSY